MEEREIPDPAAVELDVLGWVLVGAGTVGSLMLLLRRDHRVPQWLGAIALLGGGTGVLLRQRQQSIYNVRERVAMELEGLDPIAKAQVLKYVAEQSMPFRRRRDEDEED